MQTSLVPTRTFTLGVETSALSLRRDDSGNWTGGRVGVGALIGSKCGVSAPVLSAWLGRTASAADMRAVTPATMAAIFGANYWNQVHADSLPAGIDLMTVDHGFSRGAVTSAMLLQRVLGTVADGWIGAGTLAAIAGFAAASVPPSVIDAVALQEGLGVQQDGNIGPVTLAALSALSPIEGLLVALYAAQVHDYRGRKEAAANPGWFTRARNRLHAGQGLVPAASTPA
ncbi:hypothetical protein HN018_07010 [Lichenicola cladoniae]|uniref:TtsA-like Glycoside hydrolase family 108 domain-containing protein n=1 Tax=Lichenicola cladoniae TaxID=1484109 RepID=A0A6M8HN58_9PROT|nr:glycosyl hydrolase 108 family protein [Lichenicola cladoniae]NPD67323.1 hypothetical protein [Acetobacteraceae bacterium]QKE89824.1 hypothetical protein HN018_07010 [Lichenicola cladoniae]